MPEQIDAGQVKRPVWNSLEITKIILGAATPLTIFLLGFMVSRSNAEQAEVSRVLERRLSIWDGAGPKVRQIRDQSARILRNAVPNLPEDQRMATIGAEGVQGLVDGVDETLEVRPFFSPAVAQHYFDFSYCALELVEAAQFNARKGVEPFPMSRLARLWEKTDERYRKLIERVRIELSAETRLQADKAYPSRQTRLGGRDASMCLGISG